MKLSCINEGICSNNYTSDSLCAHKHINEVLCHDVIKSCNQICLISLINFRMCIILQFIFSSQNQFDWIIGNQIPYRPKLLKYFHRLLPNLYVI